MTCFHGSWRYLAVLSLLIAACSAQGMYDESNVGGQHGTSFPGACPLDKWSDVIVTVVATLPQSTTGPVSIAYTTATNYPFGNPIEGFTTSPSWNQFLNNTAAFFSVTTPTTPGGTPLPFTSAATGLKFFGECKQNLLTLQATCSFVFDYSTRRLLDLLSKASPAGGIPLGGTLTFQFCTLALGNSEVSSPTCFESRGGTPKPVIVKISSQEPADVIPQIGFNSCYKDGVPSTNKCLAFAIIQSCAANKQVAYGTTSRDYGDPHQGDYPSGGGGDMGTTQPYSAVAPAMAGLPEGISTLDSVAPATTFATAAASPAASAPLAAEEMAKKKHKKKKKKKAHIKHAASAPGAEQAAEAAPSAAVPADTTVGAFTGTSGRKLMD